MEAKRSSFQITEQHRNDPATYVEVVVVSGVFRWPRFALAATAIAATAQAEAAVTTGEEAANHKQNLKNTNVINICKQFF